MAAQYDNLWTRHSVAATEFSARELEVLIEIATVVSAASSISDINSSFAALVADVIEWDGILVTTSNADGRTFTIRLREEATLPGRAVGGTVVIDGTLHGETVKTRETQYFTADDGQTAELALKIPGLRDLLLAGFRSFLSTPLFSQGEIVGMISMRSYEPHAFSDHDRTLFERIAAFVGPTIGRFDAYEALRRDDLRNKSLLKIGRMLLGVSDIADVFEQFVEELRTVVEIDRLTISVAGPDMATVVDRYMYGVPVPGYEVNGVIPVASLKPNGVDVMSHGHILQGNAMRDADPVTSPGFYANYQAGLRSMMFAGLWSGGRLVGTINLKSLSEDAYDAADLEYFEHVADHVAASIERTLVRESETETDRVEGDRILARQNERRVVDVLRAKERLVSSASQELRTPLSGIMAFVDLLVRNRRGNLDEKQIRYLSIVRHNAEELSGQVDTLISHAERKSGQLHVSAGGFETATTVQGADTAPVPKPGEQEQSANVESYDALE